jgi:hypothetical protein
MRGRLQHRVEAATNTGFWVLFGIIVMRASAVPVREASIAKGEIRCIVLYPLPAIKEHQFRHFVAHYIHRAHPPDSQNHK